MARVLLPQDVLLLICHELAFQRDFVTLFRFSLVSRRCASMALQQLYSIHELSPVSSGEVYNRKAWARLWKSIIRSSIADTLFPYCTYVRSLSLGNFQSLLEDIANDRNVRAWLFDPEEQMDQFLVLREGQRTRLTRNKSLGWIDYLMTMIKAGESVTRYIKEVASQTQRTVALAHLEANRVPEELLPTWISRLETLTSLRIQEGDVLTAEAGSAIFASCPKFSELTCHFCRGASVDSNMAAFLQTLRPNTLRRFEVMSMNDIGEQTLMALNAHAESLKYLTLGSMSAQAMKSLNVLPSCSALESLTIENSKADPISLKAQDEDILKEITAWIQSCSNLEELTLTNVQDALLMVKDVLNTPSIQLKSLSLQGFSTQGKEHDSATWAALGLQTTLENLTLGGQIGTHDGLVIHERAPLAASICHLQNLEALNLIQAYARMSELRQFIAALPNLAELRFGGEYMDDSILDLLSTLRRLKVLVINAFSVFTWEGLKRFAFDLDAVDHEGIRVDIINQMGEQKLDDESSDWLSDYFTNTLKGKIDIGYFRDPDELHESDFSTLSD